MERSLIRFVALPVPALLASLAVGQTPTGSGYAKVSVMYPPTASARRDVNDFGIGLGVGYELPKSVLSPTGRSAFELNWARISGNSNQLNTIDFKFVERISFGGGRGGMIPYFGVGVGVSLSSLEVGGTGEIGGGSSSGGSSSGGSSSGGSSSGGSGGELLERGENDRTYRRTTPVLELLAGMQINQRSFVELSYRYSPKIAGVRQDTLTLSYGLRF